MPLVEKEVTMQNVELARNNSEFEKRCEVEQKLIPTNPEVFISLFKPEGTPVEQLYLSAPNDEFSLRLRCTVTPEGNRYTATQKDRGEIAGAALKRTEVETTITQESYEQYAAMDLPSVRKLRTTITDGLSIDFYEDEMTPVIVEIEHPDPDTRVVLRELIEEMTGDTLLDKSHDPTLTNEAIAHRLANKEQPPSPESLDSFAARVAKELIAHYVTGKNQVVAGLTGMSGSGKTTVTRAIEQHIIEAFGETYRPIILSTDDYHFGKTALETTYGAPYTAWDSPNTYNTAALADDIQKLAEGTPLLRRHFDFETEEPVFGQQAAPAPFIIIEGLYAGSKDLSGVRDIHFELPTSIATSIGRDIRRLIIENRANRAFPTPEDRLRYQIETALPLYLSQERPRSNTFTGCIRPLASRAFMLSRISR